MREAYDTITCKMKMSADDAIASTRGPFARFVRADWGRKEPRSARRATLLGTK
ncbi:hypothetical protein [Frigoriglobus tundricola]|uniref:Uncharacterized protein n=1 Tax=Frigoriglobus tundricola TaxID=2774151 RepID=A0A6M5YJC9_9BACT|nr:hypothetical protein [Frigoriglobus tundricola]QJW93664.1 hypothetical protein FTUN_1172 [Frigoriglobus tundricola]